MMRLSRGENEMAEYPMGKAQRMVIEALGLNADSFSEAEEMFAERGLIVASKREGRKSVPAIKLMDTEGGAMNADGEGDSWDMNFTSYDKSAIAQWMS